MADRFPIPKSSATVALAMVSDNMPLRVGFLRVLRGGP